MSTYRIFIVNQGGTNSVVPRAQGITRGDKVIFTAIGVRAEVSLFFPDPALFGEQIVRLSPNEPVPLPVSDSKELTPDVYPYAVYSGEIRQFVRASPSPKLIFYE